MDEFNEQSVFEKLLRETGRKGIENLISILRTIRFYDASCYGHDRRKGGTLRHSLWVLFDAKVRLKQSPDDYPGVNLTSLTLVCLLHDLGDTDQQWGYPQYHGHGKRSALILDDIRRKYGLDLTEEELGVIRFHRKNHIIDNFDRRLSVYLNSPLLKLLKKSDWTAAGIMSNIPYGGQVEETVISEEAIHVKVFYSPTEKIWFLPSDEKRNFKTEKGDIMPTALGAGVPATIVFSINLYHMWIHDLMVLKDGNDHLGLFHLVSFHNQFAKLHRTTRGGFSYKRIIFYVNRFHFHSKEAVHYVLQEDMGGQWRATRIRRGQDGKTSFEDFIQCWDLAYGLNSEKEALDAVRKGRLNGMKHGIELRNDYYFTRIPIEF